MTLDDREASTTEVGPCSEHPRHRHSAWREAEGAERRAENICGHCRLHLCLQRSAKGSDDVAETDLSAKADRAWDRDLVS